MNERMADLIEKRRKELRLSPKDLIERTGLSHQAVRNLRSGRVRRYADDTINAMADALEWREDWYDLILEGGTPIPAGQPPTPKADQLTLILQAASRASELSADVARETRLNRELIEQIAEKLGIEVDPVPAPLQ